MSNSKKDLQAVPLTRGDLKILDANGAPLAPSPQFDPGTKDSQVHDFDPKNITIEQKQRNFDQKIYMFPDSFNALRAEIHDHWPTLWALVSWRMANNAPEFVDVMNDALDLNVIFDTEQVGAICDTFLTALRKKRGLSK
jgi:hypothetical protein